MSNLATRGERLLGQFLDSLICVGIVLVSVIPMAVSESFGRVTFILGMFCAIFYYIFGDGFRGGQSYGKRVVHTAAIDATTGVPCSFGQALVRNLFLALLGIFDWIFIFGKKRQRLGDKVANTIVVKLSRPLSIRSHS